MPEWSELQEALLSAYQPAALEEATHQRIIEEALADPLAPPGEAELEEARRFTDALEGRGAHPDAALADVLRAAWEPEPPDFKPEFQAEEFARVEPQPSREFRSRPSRHAARGQVLRTTFWVGTALSAAAAVVLLTRQEILRSAAQPSLYEARSAASLFESPFERGKASERIDRLTAVRARELRENRFNQWGIR